MRAWAKSHRYTLLQRMTELVRRPRPGADTVPEEEELAEAVATGPVLLGDIRNDDGVWPLWMYNDGLDESVPIEDYSPGSWVCNR